MKKLLIIAALLASTHSVLAVSVGIAVGTDAIRMDNGNYNGEPTKPAIGLLGISTTSTFAGTTAGLIILADNGEAMVNVESEQAIALYEQLSAKSEIEGLELSAEEVHFMNLMEKAHGIK